MLVRLLTMLVFFVSAIAIVSAQLPLVTIDELEARLQAGGDTTFVVNLWATWCKPCVKELPWFDRLQRVNPPGHPLRVLLVSVDDPKDQVKVGKYLASKSYSVQTMQLNESNPNDWINRVDTSWSGAIPATLFYHASTAQRLFVEQEFTYQELEQTYRSFLRSKE